MTRRHRRWLVLALPLVLPWVVVAWDGGWYVLFSAFWIDPGPRVVTLPQYLSRTTVTLSSRSVVLAWPAALLLYLSGVATTTVRPDRPILAASLFWLAGLAVGFYALGISEQAGLVAIPVGGLVLWIVAGYAYLVTQTRRRSEPSLGEE